MTPIQQLSLLVSSVSVTVLLFWAIKTQKDKVALQKRLAVVEKDILKLKALTVIIDERTDIFKAKPAKESAASAIRDVQDIANSFTNYDG